MLRCRFSRLRYAAMPYKITLSMLPLLIYFHTLRRQDASDDVFRYAVYDTRFSRHHAMHV